MSEAAQEPNAQEAYLLELYETGLPALGWRYQAACREANGDDFYVQPSRGRGTRDPLGLVQKYCKGCEVVDQCLADNIIRGDDIVAIAGGLTKTERSPLIRDFKKLAKTAEATAKKEKAKLAPVISLRTKPASPSYHHITSPIAIRHIAPITNPQVAHDAEVVPLFDAPNAESTTDRSVRKSQLGPEMARRLLEQSRLTARLRATEELRFSYDVMAQLIDKSALSSHRYNELLEQAENLTEQLAAFDQTPRA